MEPKFKVGDHISFYGKYNIRYTGVISEYMGIYNNVDGPGTSNHCYRWIDDRTGYEQWGSEKKMKFVK